MCSIFAIAGHPEAAHLTYLGLHALQHRGQEGAGIVSNDGGKALSHRRQGLVGEIFTPQVLEELKGSASIGHTRYSTTGANNLSNLQPLLMKSSLGWTAMAHNGNLVNAAELTQSLEKMGAIFQSTNDTEAIVHLMAHSKAESPEEALIESLKMVKGAYSLLLMNASQLVAVRDPHGVRPLVMGKLGDSVVFASETCAFDLIGASFVRKVEPGEMITVNLDRPSEIQSKFPFEAAKPYRCVFEYIYFSRPDSTVYGNSVHEVRKKLGKRLALDCPSPGAEVVIPVPDSGVPAAIGYAQQAGIEFDMGIVRSHYIGRTFIEPKQSIRDFGVRLKLNPIATCVKGKSVVVVDDSLVRGTTSRKIINHLREMGAREVHVRISAPPTTNPCHYGINTPTREELMAASHPIEDIRKYIGADTLGYLSLEGLLEETTKVSGPGYCHACFSGDYPIPIN